IWSRRRSNPVFRSRKRHGADERQVQGDGRERVSRRGQGEGEQQGVVKIYNEHSRLEPAGSSAALTYRKQLKLKNRPFGNRPPPFRFMVLYLKRGKDTMPPRIVPLANDKLAFKKIL